MDNINFFYEETTFKLAHKEIISSWVSHSIASEHHQLLCLNYIFCSDDYLNRINIDYLRHDYYTDIITFNNSEKKGMIEGDIFVSIDRVRENAQNQGMSPKTELRRVIIHGVLHLLGYNDKTEGQKQEMREKENAYLSLPKFQI